MEPDKAICPNCEGSSLSCDLCHGAGFVTWDTYWDYIDRLMEIEELKECGAVAV